MVQKTLFRTEGVKTVTTRVRWGSTLNLAQTAGELESMMGWVGGWETTKRKNQGLGFWLNWLSGPADRRQSPRMRPWEKRAQWGPAQDWKRRL